MISDTETELEAEATGESGSELDKEISRHTDAMAARVQKIEARIVKQDTDSRLRESVQLLKQNETLKNVSDRVLTGLLQLLRS
jgi:hypothetical protein